MGLRLSKDSDGIIGLETAIIMLAFGMVFYAKTDEYPEAAGAMTSQ